MTNEEMLAFRREVADLVGFIDPGTGPQSVNNGLIVAALREAVAAARDRDALLKFKEYVHKRLDDAGVPVDPESPHKAEGCRIGGRIDEVFRERAALLKKLEAAEAEVSRLSAMLRPVWKAGVQAAIDYGDNVAHLRGEQADRAFHKAVRVSTAAALSSVEVTK